MKTIALILFLSGLVFAGGRILYQINAGIEYKTKVSNYWDMADRTSTISQKDEYIDKFIVALESEGLDGLNANILFITPTSSFDENFKALKSLHKRLNTISDMDENSFAYQTALQQITQQEQGEAGEMLDVFKECFMQKNYYTLWNPYIRMGFFLLQFGFIVVGAAILFD